MAVMLKTDDKAIHELFDGFLTKIQITCHANLKLLSKIGEGYSVEEAIRLSYTNPDIETPYKKHVIDAQKFLEMLRNYCIVKHIELKSIKFHILEMREKSEILSSLLEDYLRDRFLKNIMDDISAENHIVEMKKQQEILRQATEDRIKNAEEIIRINNEAIRKNNMLIEDLKNKNSDLDRAIEMEAKKIRDVVNDGFSNTIIPYLCHEFILEGIDKNNISALVIDKNNIKEIIDCVESKLIDNYKKNVFSDEELSVIADDGFNHVLNKLHAHIPESQRMEVVDAYKKKNAMPISEFINNLIGEIKSAVEPRVIEYVIKHNNALNERMENIDKINAMENENKHLMDVNDKQNEFINTLKSDLSSLGHSKDTFEDAANPYLDLLTDDLDMQIENPESNQEKELEKRASVSEKYSKFDHKATDAKIKSVSESVTNNREEKVAHQDGEVENTPRLK